MKGRQGSLRWVSAGAAVVAGVSLCGCVTVGPDYHLPARALANAPAANGALVGARDNPAVSDAPLPAHWWRLYDSPDLDRLVADALAANTDLRVADANLQRSRALVALARTQSQPKLGFEGGVERAQLSAEQYLFPGDLPELTLYDVNLAASYELDLFGRIKRGVEAAKAEDEAVEAARDWVRVSVVADVAKAYVDVCVTGNELAVAQRSLELQRQSLAYTNRLREGGRATDLDQARSRSLVYQLQATIPAVQTRRRNALFRLATLTGKPPSMFEADLERCVSAPAISQPIPVGDGAALLKRRPDVRAAERELAAATAQIGVATAALYPRVVLGASIGSTGLTRDFLSRPTNDFAIGPSVTWELNQSPARARISAAKAAQQAQLARFDDVVLGALRDIEMSLNAYAHDLEREKNLTAARDEAKRALEDAGRLQSTGRAGALATLDAERTLESAEASLAAVQTQVAQDQIAVFLALGGGWQTDAQGQS